MILAKYLLILLIYPN